MAGNLDVFRAQIIGFSPGQKVRFIGEIKVENADEKVGVAMQPGVCRWAISR